MKTKELYLCLAQQDAITCEIIPKVVVVNYSEPVNKKWGEDCRENYHVERFSPLFKESNKRESLL